MRHPNATRSAAIILIIIGNSLQKQDITSHIAFEVVSNHMIFVQHAEIFLPTQADVNEVFNDAELRKLMTKW